MKESTRTRGDVFEKKKEMQENEPIAVTANAERYYPEDKQGLTTAQVEERQRKGLVNAAVDTEFITTKQIVINNVFTYFNLIFVVLGVLLMLVQSYKNMTFLPVVIINTVIGIYQEIKSKKVLDSLNILNATKVTVVRDATKNKKFRQMNWFWTMWCSLNRVNRFLGMQLSYLVKSV